LPEYSFQERRITKLSVKITVCLVGLLLLGCAELVGLFPFWHDAGLGRLQLFDSQTLLNDPKHVFWSEPALEVFQVRFETTRGSFTIEVHRSWAPHGADRFYNLTRAKFFDDSRFFRVRAGYIAQFGIPGDPALAGTWQNQTVPDDPVQQSNTRGSVAFAMTGPGTRTTQLYINLADNSKLDAQGFAPIGKVIDGMGTVDQLYSGYGEDAAEECEAESKERFWKEATNTSILHSPSLIN
jgi:cyclophilin family peptidyl-prolyl cis-trans isomerase